MLQLVLALGIGFQASAPTTSAVQREDCVTYSPQDGPGKDKRLVFLTGDEEYRSEEGLPMLAKILSQRHGFKCTVLFSLAQDGTIKPDNGASLAGAEMLDSADGIIMQLRYRAWPDAAMKHFVDAYHRGVPIIALRTSTHAFLYPANSKSVYKSFTNFGKNVLGEGWVSHWGPNRKGATRGVIEPSAKGDPLLHGVADIFADSGAYEVHPADDVKILLRAQVLKGMKPTDAPADYKKKRASDKVEQGVNDPMMAAGWTRTHKNPAGKENRVFCTTLGAATDLQCDDLRRLVVNAVYWGFGLEVPARADVAYVGDFKPSAYGFNGYKKGIKPADLGLGKTELPRAADDRLIVELVAHEPDIVTPTGVAVDERGRIWVIENHTHQRPAKYAGPPSDRIRIFEDFGPDGKARKITNWADGFQDTMGILLGKGGDVFVATRSAIYVLHDVQGKGKADEKLVLARLETQTTYPHNGLSGFSVDALGDIYFGLGENFGAAYKLIGRDNMTLTGGGEGGSIYRMKPDGSDLTRIATGFWNPFHTTFDRWGRLFAVDNDPDARGPCRLLHIVQDGDYGYRFKYGRKGIHPFQSWNGELPGTLPMVAGTAEAPSGILAYESNGLPPEYRGLLLVTCWGDHVIEQFKLEPRGASFGATKKIMVRGDENFRPVGIAVAPDGSLIVSDWVDKSYPVHGKGRLWRIRLRDAASDTPLSPADIAKQETAQIAPLLAHPRREVRLSAAGTLASREPKPGDLLLPILRDNSDPLARLHALWALAKQWPTEAQSALAVALRDSSPEVREEATALAGRLLTHAELRKLEPVLTQLALKDSAATVRRQAIQVVGRISNAAGQTRLVPLLGDDDPFVVSAALSALEKADSAVLADAAAVKQASQRLGVLLALRRLSSRAAQDKLPAFLDDADPAIRRTAIQWVGEERLINYGQLLDKAAIKPPVTRDVFEAWLAAKELLANPGNPKNPNNEPAGDTFVLKIVADAKQPAAFRALALRMLRPDHPKLKLPDLLALTKADDSALRAEAVKSLAWRSTSTAQQALRELAVDNKLPVALRDDAVLGLALSAQNNAASRKLLVQLANDPAIAADALRSLRAALTTEDAGFLGPWWQALTQKPVAAAEREDLAEHAMFALGQPLAAKAQAAGIKLATPRPDNLAAWRDLLRESKGNPVAGERVFFHARGPRCFACHRIDGRGEAIGPDLSRIGAAMSRDKLIESILEPSKEIAPAFVTWLITMRNGKQHSGVIVAEGFDSTLTIGDASGKRTVLDVIDIEDRVAQKTSIMPADLHGQMTRREFADLLAFLEGRK